MTQNNNLKTQSINIMKNITGKIIGFVAGVSGFLFLFKMLFLNNVAPEDELAPGIVIIAAVLTGLLFSFAGHLAQDYFGKKRN